MSVINDMLRDLEARKAPERDGLSKANIAELIEPASDSVLSKGKLLALIVLLVAAALGAGLYLLLQPAQDATSNMPVRVDAPAMQQAPAIVDEAQSDEPEKVTAKANNVAIEDSPVAVAESSSVSASNIAVVSEPDQAPEPITATSSAKPPTKSTPVKPELNKTTASVSTKEAAVDVTAPESKGENIASVAATPKALPQKDLVRKPLVPARVDTVAQTEVAPKQMITLSPDALDEQNAMAVHELFVDGDDQKAYRQLYNFIERHETDQQSRITLATYLLRDQRLAEAGDSLSGLSTENNPQARQLKARWLMAMGEQDQALALLESRLPEFEDYQGYYELLASYYQQFGQPEQAITIYSDLIRSNSQRSDWWAGLAIALDRAGQYKDALTAYKQALQLPGLGANVQQFVEQRVKQLAG